MGILDSGAIGKIENRYLGHYKKTAKKEQNQITPQAGLEPRAADYTTVPKRKSLPRSARKLSQLE